MPLLRRHHPLFDQQQLAEVRRVHRWAVLFGVVTPLALLLATVIKTQRLFGVWPTILRVSFEHVLYYGWAGMYVFGLLSFLLPQLSDQTTDDRDRRRFFLFFLIYGSGIALIVMQALCQFFNIPLLGHVLWSVAGSLLQLSALVLWQYHVSTWLSRGRNMHPTLQATRTAGQWFLLAGAMLHAVLSVSRFLSGTAVLGLGAQLALRLLPVLGLGLIVFGILIRMVPELLGWRPLEDDRIKHICLVLLIGGIIAAFGEPLYHQVGGVLGTVLYLGSAAIVFAGMAWLLLSLDVLHIRLAPLVNREHVPYIYASLFWLLLSCGMYLVTSFAEIMRGVPHVFWSESTLIAYVGGFIGLGLMGLYTYWINQEPGSYEHNDRLAMIAFIFLQWVLVLRVLVYPLAEATGWEGSFAFRWIFDAFFIIGIALISLDMYDGLLGHCWHAPWRGKK